MYIDNQAWLLSERSMRKAKHIERRHHFIAEFYERGFILSEHIPLEESLADGFTKSLDRITFELWRDRIGLRRIYTNPK